MERIRKLTIEGRLFCTQEYANTLSARLRKYTVDKHTLMAVASCLNTEQ